MSPRQAAVMLILVLPVLLLVRPTCSDTWWNGVDVIFGSSHGTLRYSHSEAGEGGQRQREEESAVAVLLGIPDTTAVVGTIFEYGIRNSAFQGSISKLTVEEAGRYTLPSWVFFNNTTNTFLGVPTAQDEGSTSIEVTAHSYKHRTTASFLIDVKPANQLHPAWSRDGALPLRLFKEGDTERHNDVICSWDETIIYTTLLLDTDVERLSAEQRVNVLVKLAHYLSRDVRTITFAAAKKRDPMQGFIHTRVLVAGPGNVGVGGRQTVGAELSWISGCGEFSHSADVAMMMERNIKSGKVTESVGFDVIGWHVWDNRPVPRRFKRQIRGTPIDTPRIGTPLPTRLPSVATVVDIPRTQFQSSSVLLDSHKTVVPSRAAFLSTLTALSSSSIAVTPSFVLPKLSSSLYPMTTPDAVATSVLLSTSTPEFSTLYISTSATLTTPLTVATMPLSIATMPLSIATTPFAGSSTIIPATSVISLPILPTRSTEVVTPLETSLMGDTISSTPVQPPGSLVSTTLAISPSSLIEESVSVQDTPSPLLVPSSVFSSSISVNETMSVAASPSSAFNSDSTFPSIPVPSSFFSLYSMPGSDFVSFAYTGASKSVISSDVTVVPSLVTLMPSTQTVLVETTNVDTTPSVDVSTNVYASQSSQRIVSLGGFESTSTADSIVMTPTAESVATATITRLLTPDVTAATTRVATSDLYSPASSSSVLLPLITSLEYLVTTSPSITFTYSESPTFSFGVPLSTSAYSSFQQSAILMSSSVSSFSSSSDIASTVMTPSSIATVFETMTSTPVLKSSLVLHSSIEEFGSTAAVFETVSSTGVSTSVQIEQSSVETSPHVTAVTPGVSEYETTIYASMTISHSVPFETFKLVPASTPTEFFPELPSLSLTSLTFASNLTPLPSTRVMGLTESVYPASSVTPAVGTLSSVLPLETSSLIVSSLSSRVTTVSTTQATSSITEVMSTDVTTIPAAIQHPKLVNHIDKILVRLGTYFELTVPADTFYDVQDGDTTRLSLRLVTIYNDSLPLSSWVRLDTERQVLYGLPLATDVSELPSEYALVVSNSYGLTVSDAIQIIVDVTVLGDISHCFVVNLRLNYTDFMRTPMENLKVVVKKLAAYFGDVSSTDNDNNNYVSVTNLTEGSVQISWTNNTLSKIICQNETIKELFARMSHNGSVSDLFRRFMLPKIPVVSVRLEMLGICAYNGSSANGETTVGVISSADSVIWLVTVIPAVVVVALIIIIILAVIIRNKRRSQRGRYLPDSEKPIFGKNRKPILMPEEIEMLDLGLRPKKPVTMPADDGRHLYTNPAYEHDPQLPPPYHQPESLPREAGSSPPVYDIAGACNEPPPMYRLPPPYVANTNDTVIL